MPRRMKRTGATTWMFIMHRFFALALALGFAMPAGAQPASSVTPAQNFAEASPAAAPVPAGPDPALVDPSKLGARGDGVTDDLPAFAASEKASNRSNGLLVFVGPGTYKIGAPVPDLGKDTWLIAPGANFTGPGFPGAATDGSALNHGRSGMALMRFSQDRVGSNTLHVSHRIGPSGAPGSYEKEGIYARVTTSDASDYSDGSMRDAVGMESQCQFAGSIKTGRCWGYDTVVTIPTGTDGYAVGMEIGLENNAVDQPHIDRADTKVGLHLVSGGTVPSTAAIVINKGPRSAPWHDGAVFDATSIGGKAWTVRGPSGDVAYADVSGDIRAVGLSAATLTAGVVAVAGSARNSQAVSSGFAYSVPSTTAVLVLRSATALDNGTVTLPATPVDGQLLRIVATNTVAHLAVVPNAGQTVSGAPATIGPAFPAGFLWDSTSSTWLRIQ